MYQMYLNQGKEWLKTASLILIQARRNRRNEQNSGVGVGVMEGGVGGGTACL